MSDVEMAIVPGITHWESPKFYAYFKPHASYPSILGEMLAAGFNAMGFSWIASPACTELETLCMDWLARLLDLPPCFLSVSPAPAPALATSAPSSTAAPAPPARGGGVIQGSAGEAAIVVLLAAIARAYERAGLGHGSSGQGSSQEQRDALRASMVVYTSDQAHSIIEKSCMVVGIPLCRLRKLRTRAADAFALQPAELRAAIAADRAQGLLPVLVAVTYGTTSSCAIDPLGELADVAHEVGAWCHLDAAYGGAYLCCPEFRALARGLEKVDSLVMNCHKKLLVNFDCAALWVRDRLPLLQALSLTPEYLKNSASDSGAVIDYKDWQLPLGRRFRALKLWFVLRSYGAVGIRAHIRNGVRLAQKVEAAVRASTAFSLVVPRSMALVVFRLNASDEANLFLLEQLNRRSNCFIIHSQLASGPGGEGQKVLRFAVGGAEATEEDVMAAWQEICAVVPLVKEKFNITAF